MGLYNPTILGGNSYLSWFYDRGAIKGPPHTGTSEGLSQAINRGPIRKFLPNYANVYVTIQSHGLSAGVRTHYVTINGVRDGLAGSVTPHCPLPDHGRGSGGGGGESGEGGGGCQERGGGVRRGGGGIGGVSGGGEA